MISIPIRKKKRNNMKIIRSDIGKEYYSQRRSWGVANRGHGPPSSFEKKNDDYMVIMKDTTSGIMVLRR
jgi:hypothetical protein